MNPSRQSYYKIAFLTAIALVVVTFGIEYFQYVRHERLILTDLKNRLDEQTINVNMRARSVQGHVNSLKTAAENSLFFIKKFNLTSFLFPLLRDSPDRKSFYLDTSSLKTNKEVVGNLVGVRSIRSFSKDHRNEINMALFLNTYFPVVLKNLRGGLRAYYISKNHFQTIYPWVDSTTEMAIPPKIWTQAYHEKPVVTNTSPVYDGDKFLGAVSIDFSLAELEYVMNQFPSSSGDLYLINKEHQVLAKTGGSKQMSHLTDFLSKEVIHRIDQAIQHPTNWFSVNGPSVIYVKDLHAAPWYLVYVDSKSTLFWEAFFEALTGILIISLVLVIVVGLGYFFVIRNFIAPSERLIKHIEKENKGLKSTPQNLPPRWQPWFDIVTRIFKENRTLVEDLEHRVADRTQQLSEKNQELEKTLTALKKAKNQIIVQEKLASLGHLTAGIAHEIKNPLNFIINFTDLSLEYLDELKEKIPEESELLNLIEQNMSKSREHAEKADAIVKAMLAHARGSTGEITTFDLNDLLSQAIDLAYFGFQGQEPGFSAKIIKDFDEHIGMIQGFAQELTRVFLNIVNNALFSMHEKRKTLGSYHVSELIITTRDKGESIEITFQDNGKGMSHATLNKIFTPFFTTKGAGKGTGLGLSLSYDIITRQHHGQLTAESTVGEYARFVIELPRRL